MVKTIDYVALTTLVLIFLYLMADLPQLNSHGLRDDCLAVMVCANLISLALRVEGRPPS